MTEGLISRQKDMKNLSVIVIRFDRYAEYPPPLVTKEMKLFKMPPNIFHIIIQLMKITETLFGKGFLSAIMKVTFYGHFVAGENQYKIMPCISR